MALFKMKTAIIQTLVIKGVLLLFCNISIVKEKVLKTNQEMKCGKTSNLFVLKP